MRTESIGFILAVVWLSLMVGGSNGQENNGTANVWRTMRMLWVYPTPLNDFGYAYAIDRARLLVEEELATEGTPKRRKRRRLKGVERSRRGKGQKKAPPSTVH